MGSDDYYYGLNYDGWGDYSGDWYATAWDDYDWDTTYIGLLGYIPGYMLVIFTKFSKFPKRGYKPKGIYPSNPLYCD
mgnify:CR=1 FL=1